MSKKLGNISIENARIGFKNFAGEAGKFNKKGDRNFCVFIDEQDLEHTLINDGWNVKHLKPKDEDETPQAYLQVSAAYENFPPRIMLISGTNKTILEEETVNILDWADIEAVDIIIRPYEWEVNGKTGVKAYVKTMYVTIAEDKFANKYEAAPDSAQSCILGPDGKCID